MDMNMENNLNPDDDTSDTISIMTSPSITYDINQDLEEILSEVGIGIRMKTHIIQALAQRTKNKQVNKRMRDISSTDDDDFQIEKSKKKSTRRPKTNILFTPPTHVTLSNRFGPLLGEDEINQDSETQNNQYQEKQQEQEKQSKKQQAPPLNNRQTPQSSTSGTSRKPPPVIIKQVPNHLSFIKDCVKITDDPNLICSYTVEGLKIQPKSSESHNKLTKHLMTEKIEYHTFVASTERPLKLVIKQLPPTITEDELYRELLRLNYPVKAVRQFTTKANDSQEARKLPIWIVTLENSPEGAALQQCTGLFNIKMIIESYRPKPTVRQCFNCQAFGHLSIGCHHKTQCVKCTGDHAVADCPRKGPQYEPLCANCGEKHTASYRQCPKFISYATRTMPKPPPRPDTNYPSRPHPASSTSWARIASKNTNSITQPTRNPVLKEIDEVQDLLRSINLRTFLQQLKETFGHLHDILTTIKEVTASLELFQMPSQHGP